MNAFAPIADPASEWERCKPLILSALEHGLHCHTIEDVWAGVQDGRFQFWPAATTAVVTEIIQYPRQKVLNWFLAAGTREELFAMEPYIISFGRFHGCSHMIIIGRDGWVPVLKDRNWEKLHTLLSKEIPPAS